MRIHGSQRMCGRQSEKSLQDSVLPFYDVDPGLEASKLLYALDRLARRFLLVGRIMEHKNDYQNG